MPVPKKQPSKGVQSGAGSVRKPLNKADSDSEDSETEDESTEEEEEEEEDESEEEENSQDGDDDGDGDDSDASEKNKIKNEDNRSAKFANKPEPPAGSKTQSEPEKPSKPRHSLSRPSLRDDQATELKEKIDKLELMVNQCQTDQTISRQKLSSLEVNVKEIHEKVCQFYDKLSNLGQALEDSKSGASPNERSSSPKNDMTTKPTTAAQVDTNNKNEESVQQPLKFDLSLNGIVRKLPPDEKLYYDEQVTRIRQIPFDELLQQILE